MEAAPVFVEPVFMEPRPESGPQPSLAALTINTPPTATGSARVEPRESEPPMTTVADDPTASLIDPPRGGAVAVSYLRVSTREQAEKGGTDEGFSIPAQREATRRKAEQLGAGIVEEFVDAGPSAKSADRPELMRMIQYVKANKVSYCIVHKVDRLARNRADDVSIHLALQQCGVMPVSATENIDETPSGMLLHGIMSTIAEFYSHNLATEVAKGMNQKAIGGGTNGKAPIGYLNVRTRDELGRELRTIELDPERAPIIEWAFKAYASGTMNCASSTTGPSRCCSTHRSTRTR